MEQFPNTESDIQKVYRIAKQLGIGVEEAADMCDAFHLAFSDDRMRRAIFDVIDELDRSAARKGEPLGLIINYTVELSMEGIRVGRYADEIPAGEIVELTPPHRANILLRIVDNFPTQEFLGPLIVNRPEPLVEACSAAVGGLNWDNTKLPSLAGRSTGQSSWPERGVAAVSTDGVVCSDKVGQDGLNSDINELPSLGKEGCPTGRGGLTSSDITQPDLPTELPSHWPKIAIPLGPIRPKFNERFPFVSGRGSEGPGAVSQLSVSGVAATHSLSLVTSHLSSVTCNPSPGSNSGLSPPLPFGDPGHSETKDVHRPLANRVETSVSPIWIFEN